MPPRKNSEKGGGPRVDALYGLMQSFENKLGGGEGVEGLYGSITQGGMQKILECLAHNTGLDHRSTFIDIGAGLGRPLLHAMVSHGVPCTWGVELDKVKCDKAAAFCQHVLGNLVTKEVLPAGVAVPPVHCSPVEKFASLDPATHAYSFWEGVPASGKRAFGELFAKSKSLRAVAVVQRAMRGQEPAAVMREMGFGPLILINSFSVSMSGSGRSFQAYVFSKITPEARRFFTAALATAPPAALQPQQKEAEKEEGQEQAAGPPPLPQSSSGVEAAALPVLELSQQPTQPEPVAREAEEQLQQGRQAAAAAVPARAGRGARAASRSGSNSSRAPQPGTPTGSPSKSCRKSADGETAPESPSKKLCAEPEAQKQDAAVAVAAAATPGPSSEAAAAAAAAGKGRAAAAVPDMASAVKPAVRPPREELPAPAAAAAAAAAARASRAPLQQRQLTSMPEFSRRTKAAPAVKPGKAAAAGPAAAVSGTRSSTRLAAKALAADLAAATGLGQQQEAQ
ncbi:hypothetical protein CHLRE_08g365550v5 [Chlamydomonas reinhardtii]|uniref:DOT1 domain-containing protein n=1 Tax=Chlamydomonas reinhardtii TaxID=3055 RepID=A0A2K3DGW5_CHLRE|nr:uncharacterized protein CHLRE_08g365550v5 [Chlamydomonas reinhardtii]PNW79759.1 hypothetical protein CHLRE_08g365550v5 [Chlamydomonas reinhardtii]